MNLLCAGLFHGVAHHHIADGVYQKEVSTSLRSAVQAGSSLANAPVGSYLDSSRHEVHLHALHVFFDDVGIAHAHHAAHHLLFFSGKVYLFLVIFFCMSIIIDMIFSMRGL